eukprot:2120367-Prorocentrum_lima.AAC.1
MSSREGVCPDLRAEINAGGVQGGDAIDDGAVQAVTHCILLLGCLGRSPPVARPTSQNGHAGAQAKPSNSLEPKGACARSASYYYCKSPCKASRDPRASH